MAESPSQETFHPQERDVENAPEAGSFNSTWSNDDTAGLLPHNIPIKSRARAWDRVPHSPFTAKQNIPHSLRSKVWRRVRMPVTNQIRSGTIRAESVRNSPRPRGWSPSVNGCFSSESPKKAIKKLCLKTPFGQDWRTTAWERAKHPETHKKVWQPPIILRSGTVIDQETLYNDGVSGGADNIPEEGVIGVDDNADEDEEEEEEEEEEADGKQEDEDEETEEYESELEDADERIISHDIEGRDDIVVEDDRWEDLDTDVEDEADKSVSDTFAQESAEIPDLTPSVEIRGSEDGLAIDPNVETNIASSHEVLPSLEATIKAPINQDHIGSPPPDIMNSPSNLESNSLAAPIMIERPNSAPPEETIPAGQRRKPRMSDDTAFLHAFLDRSAASKKPTIPKRESLTNKKDSEMIRQALASPIKTDILAELDANSPSPHKHARQTNVVKTQSEEQERGEKDGFTMESMPKRRSGRQRNKPVFLVNQGNGEGLSKPPNKITIKGANDSIAVKKSEAQEMAQLVRSNTRKNRGQSIMPVARLKQLSEDPEKYIEEGQQQLGSEVAKVSNGRNIRWDETLVYFSKSPEDADEVETNALQTGSAAEIEELDKKIEKSHRKAVKTRSQKVEEAKDSKVVMEGEAKEEIDVDVEKTKIMTPSAKQRRSRIATPAKASKSKAATASLNEEVEPIKASVTSDKQAKPTSKTNEPTGSSAKFNSNVPIKKRGIPTPKKLSSLLAISGNTSNNIISSTTNNDKESTKKPVLTASLPSFHVSPKKAPSPTKQATNRFLSSTMAPPPSLALFAPSLPSTSFSSSSFSSSSEPDPFRTSSTTTPFTSSTSSQTTRLASPAKKRRRMPVVQSSTNHSQKDETSTDGNNKRLGMSDNIMPGMMSPAKKRTRNAL